MNDHDIAFLAAGAATVAAIAALALLYYSLRSARAAERAAKAAEEQTAIQDQLRKDAAQPYVWVDVRPDEVTSVLLNLVIGNSGPTVATNVRVSIDPPLPAIDQLKDRAQTAQDLLAHGIKSLPPGRTLVWPLGQGFSILRGSGPQVHTFTIEADGPFGPVPPQSYPLDLSDWNGAMHRPAGSLDQVATAIKNLTSHIAQQRPAAPEPQAGYGELSPGGADQEAETEEQRLHLAEASRPLPVQGASRPPVEPAG